MYFKPNGETWVRVGTETRALRGHELFVHICAHYSRAGSPVTASADRARVAAEEVARPRPEGGHQVAIARKEIEAAGLGQAVNAVNKLVDDSSPLA